MAGTDVGDIIGAAQVLAEKQNERQATAVRLLPRLHWALLYIIGGLFVCTFLLFETGGGFSDEGRHVLFSVLCGLMTFVLCVSCLICNPREFLEVLCSPCKSKSSGLCVDVYSCFEGSHSTASDCKATRMHCALPGSCRL
jgi:hypothetical protein